MTLAADPQTHASGLSACPACVAAPSAERLAQLSAPQEARLMLSIPAAHCATCISTVETGLEALPGIRQVRVNLTLKRVLVEAEPDVTAQSLIPELARLGYEAHELDAGALSATETDRQGRELLMRLGVAGFSMMNIMLLSVAVWSGATDATRDLFHWISGMIAVPTVIFAGQPFFKSAWASVKAGRLGMDFPISLAIVLATSISIYETWHSGHHAYFDAAVMLTFFLLAGRYLDHRTRAVARSAAQELAALEVPRAILLRDGAEVTVPVGELSKGDLVLVRPGGRVPVDGLIVAGTSEIDRSLLTGESLPSYAGPDVLVSAGEVNLTGPLTVQVLAAGKDTSLSRMAELVAVAETAKTKYTSLADRAASAYSPLVHLLSFSAFGYWMWATGGDLRFAINISAATLIITCPCALGLAVPAVVTAASGKLFKKGLLIKSGTALERLAEVDTVVFDKTGTLTMGAPEPTNLHSHATEVLELAMALANASSHPLAQSLAQAARAAGIRPATLGDVTEVPGYGIEARHNDRRLRLGRAAWVGAEALDVTATYLQLPDGSVHSFTFEDTLRTGAAEVVQGLRAQGHDIWLVSGDAPGAVHAMAQRLGIENWIAGALPEDKSAKVAAMTAAGKRVLMVGDGLNDTAALAGAHVSVSPASALDAARVASDIVLLGRDIAPIADAVRIGRQSTRRIRENFWISGLYNVVAVPIALVGLCTPLWAAVAMSTSSITVIVNALRLK
jgi:P-type Cu2+ transporter